MVYNQKPCQVSFSSVTPPTIKTSPFKSMAPINLVSTILPHSPHSQLSQAPFPEVYQSTILRPNLPYLLLKQAWEEPWLSATQWLKLPCLVYRALSRELYQQVTLPHNLLYQILNPPWLEHLQ